MALAVMNQLAHDGRVHRGRVGIAVQDVTSDVAEALGLGEVRGAVIAGVEPGSPAQRAGLAAGDVVTAVDGRPVHSAASLRNRIGLTPAGTSVTLSVRRSDGPRNVSVRISS
jgi:serine protease DegQ